MGTEKEKREKGTVLGAADTAIYQMFAVEELDLGKCDLYTAARHFRVLTLKWESAHEEKLHKRLDLNTFSVAHSVAVNCNKQKQQQQKSGREDNTGRDAAFMSM